MVINPPQPVIKRASSEPPSRLLPYEQQIARTPAPAASPQESTPQEHAIAPAATAAPEPGAQESPGATADKQADAPAEGAASSDTTALPPDESADPSDPAGAQLPWRNAGRPDPAIPGQGAEAPDPMAALPGEGADPSDPMAAPPAADGAEPYDPNAALPGDGADPSDPNAALPGEPGQGYEEWVQVLVSGAAMQSAAADDAPMLFAFPYGRNLRVVSRYEGWVEVTDPQSAATGWMKAQYLAPVAAPGAPQESEAYYDDEPQERRGWFRRRPGGLADMINRALGGN